MLTTEHPSSNTLHHIRNIAPMASAIRVPMVSVLDEEPKVHSSHSVNVPRPSMMQRLMIKIATLPSIPSPVVLALCFLCLWAGSSVNFGAALPTPDSGPLLKSRPARSLMMLSNDAAHALKAAAAPAVQTQSIITDVDMGRFETVALNMSGFLNVRPPIGHGVSGESSMRAIPFQVISWYPRITYYPGFLSIQQSERIVALAKTFVTPSDLAYRPGESIPESQEVRTSSGCFLAAAQDSTGTFTEIEEKIAAVTHLPIEYGEAFNVLKYENMQHYDSHYDSFDPKMYGKQPSQRIATLLIFLQAPEEGGETVFKREGDKNSNITIADWRTCNDNLGIKVKPKTGDAVLFWSTTPDLTLDPHALHGACPVIRGQKWSMVKWIHERPVTGKRQHVRQ